MSPNRSWLTIWIRPGRTIAKLTKHAWWKVMIPISLCYILLTHVFSYTITGDHPTSQRSIVVIFLIGFVMAISIILWHVWCGFLWLILRLFRCPTPFYRVRGVISWHFILTLPLVLSMLFVQLARSRFLGQEPLMFIASASVVVSLIYYLATLYATFRIAFACKAWTALGAICSVVAMISGLIIWVMHQSA